MVSPPLRIARVPLETVVTRIEIVLRDNAERAYCRKGPAVLAVQFVNAIAV